METIEAMFVLVGIVCVFFIGVAIGGYLAQLDKPNTWTFCSKAYTCLPDDMRECDEWKICMEVMDKFRDAEGYR